MVQALARAAERGKQVTVVVELRERILKLIERERRRAAERQPAEIRAAVGRACAGRVGRRPRARDLARSHQVTPPEPRLEPEEARLLGKGVGEFNAGFFFECHDTLEEMWAGIRGPSRDFFQGLIQVSVAFYHLTNDNPAGAESVLERALKKLERYPDRYFGFDLARQRGEIRAWLERIHAGPPASIRLEDLPKWRFDEAAS